MVRNQSRLEGGRVGEIGGGIILNLRGGRRKGSPGDGRRGVIGQGQHIVDETGQGPGEDAEMTSNRALTTSGVVGDCAGLVQFKGTAGGILHDQGRRAASIHVDTVRGADQQQPGSGFPVPRAVTVTRLPAIDGQQIEIATVL